MNFNADADAYADSPMQNRQWEAVGKSQKKKPSEKLIVTDGSTSYFLLFVQKSSA